MPRSPWTRTGGVKNRFCCYSCRRIDRIGPPVSGAAPEWVGPEARGFSPAAPRPLRRLRRAAPDHRARHRCELRARSMCRPYLVRDRAGRRARHTGRRGAVALARQASAHEKRPPSRWPFFWPFWLWRELSPGHDSALGLNARNITDIKFMDVLLGEAAHALANCDSTGRTESIYPSVATTARLNARGRTRLLVRDRIAAAG
jgi:hypothetical protein